MQKRWVIFALTVGPMLTFAMQFSMVSVALPELTRDLDAPIRWTGWVVTAFMIAQVVSMPVAGRLSERFGARNVFLVGFAIFSAASMVSALAPHISILILGRAVQGAAGGALFPSVMGLVGEAFGKDRARPIGLMGSVIPIGGIIGPTLGGLIVDTIGWRWTFAINLPIGVVVVALGLLYLRSGARRPTAGLDYQGMALLGASLTSLIYALTELGRPEPQYPLIGAAAAVVVVAGALFARRQLTATSPIVDLELLKMRPLIFTNALAFCMGTALFAVFSVLPLYVEERYEMGPAEAGALLTPRAMAMVASSAVGAMLLTRTGFRRPMVAGMFVMAFTLLVLSFGIDEPTVLGVQLSNFVWIGGIVALMGVSFGMTMPSMNNAALEVAPDRIPAITGLRGMFQSLGGSVGVSVILLVVSRSGSAAAGLEASFIGLAVVLVLSTLLVRGIPEIGEGEAAPSAPEPAGAPAGAGRGAAVEAGAPSRQPEAGG